MPIERTSAPAVPRTGGHNPGRPILGLRARDRVERPLAGPPGGGAPDQGENPVLAGYSERAVARTVAGPVTLDGAAANVFHLVLEGDASVGLAPPPASAGGDNRARTVSVFVQQDAAGGHALTWDALVAWNDGLAAGPPPQPEAFVVVALQWVDSLGFWVGFHRGDNREVPA
mgnify:CR=1 FL=1